uniref:Uncharacterized protein n=1 Tax=viral metagenome TaxID=1070528 RepID=A0A6M3KQ46_9ZZZZ
MAKPLMPASPSNLRGRLDTADSFFGGQPTPPAKKEYLAQLWQLVYGAACQPYAMALLCVDTTDKAATHWNFAQMVPIGVRALRAYLTRSLTPDIAAGSVLPDSEIWSIGTAPADEINVPSGFGDAQGGAIFPPEIVVVMPTSDVYDLAPAAGDDHSMECTERLYPIYELMKALYPIGMGFEPAVRTPDLSAL